MPESVFRFAPSPNGYLHLGHALSALMNVDMARKAGGRFLLRIEDIDTARYRPEFEAAIYEDLRWLGLDWEEPVRRQSEHLHDYREALKTLEQRHLVYSSFESRGEIAALVTERETHLPSGASWPRDPDGAPLYPGQSKDMSDAVRQARRKAGDAYAIRIDNAAARREAGPLTFSETGSGPDGQTGILDAQPQLWGDAVLARKDFPTSYHLSVVIDDALQGITHVVRGQDLFFATGFHRLLQDLLGFPAPTYCHHRLILDADGRKLSKSTSATALRDLRADGVTPGDIRRMAGLPAG